MLGLLVAGQTSLVENIEVCAGQRNLSAKLEIEACSALIESSAVKPQGLAIAYNNRGNAYIKQADYDRAIQDFDQSLKIKPNYAKALNNRGVAYQKKGQHDRSLQDFNQAIKLDANYASAFANRAEAINTSENINRRLKTTMRSSGFSPNGPSLAMDGV